MKLDEIWWMDQVPTGVEGLIPMTPDEIDNLPDQARIWAAIRVAVNQAYSEGYTTCFKEFEPDVGF